MKVESMGLTGTSSRSDVLIQALLEAQFGDMYWLRDIVLDVIDAGYTRDRLVIFGVRTLKLERWQAEDMLAILVDGYLAVKLH